MPQRPLETILQSQGFGTRKLCRALVAQGEVTVAGESVTDPKRRFEPEGLAVEVQGAPWRCRARVYLALHKPRGYECSRKPGHHASVFSLLPAPIVIRGAQPVGRLDQDASGLLLLSDDGRFNHALTSPRRHVTKTYEVTTRDAVTPQLVSRLLEGVTLHGEKQPLAALACRTLGSHRVELKIDQGRYHQVKRMLAAAGSASLALHRTAIGDLALERLDLAEGHWRELTDAERALFGR